MSSTRINSLNLGSAVEQTLAVICKNTSVPTIVITRDCRVVVTNELAEKCLQTADILMLQNGTLSTVHREHERSFLKAVRASAEHQNPTSEKLVPIQNKDSGTIVPVVVESLDLSIIDPARQNDFAIVRIANADAGYTVSPSHLKLTWGLSKAESRIVHGLLRGQTLAQIATRNFVSLHTVRTQLKSIYAKTGVKRQVELVLQMYPLAESTATT